MNDKKMNYLSGFSIKLPNSIQMLTNRIQQIFGPLQKQIQSLKIDSGTISLLTKACQRFADTIQKIKEENYELSETMLQYGWCMSSTIAARCKSEIVESARMSNENRLNDYMISVISEGLNDIEKELRDKYFQRAHIIECAFECHRNMRYEASIPLFLIQADGICVDLFGGSLFNKTKEKVPRVAEAIEKLIEESDLMDSLIYPLKNNNPLCASENSDCYNPNVINRHTIVHGKDVDYASEINSYKAISVIDFIGNVASAIKV